jgi:transcriptional regulator with XRE-family HTH domain
MQAFGGVMRNIKELLGLRLKELRKSKGFSQAELSELISVDSKHISRLETGKTFPGPETLEGLAKALKVPVKEFFEFEQLDESNVDIQSIEELLKSAGEEKLKLICKVIRAILR